jgi:hypothetical protein
MAKKEYGHCQYHGKFELTEWNDWQCPKCAKEIYDFGQWRGNGKALTDDAKNLLKRAGVKF